MTMTLAWKEFREHRGIWLAMVAMAVLAGLAMGQINYNPGEAPATRAITVLAMAAVYGVVCGSMMFAGEREGGTLVLLDIFLGRRGLLWLGKLLIGMLLVTTQALAVAWLLYLFKQDPPDWLHKVVGHSWHVGGWAPPNAEPRASLSHWFMVLPVVALEAYAWGLLCSSWTQRVLAAAGLGLVIGFPIWGILLAIPAPASLMIRLIVFSLVLFGSWTIFINMLRDMPLLAVPEPERADPRRVVMRQIEREMLLGVRYSEIDETEVIPVVTPIVEEAAPLPRPRRKVRQAGSPREALLWLTWRQGALSIFLLGAACLFVGLFLSSFGELLWPIGTLLLGVACGLGTFAWEQSEQSYQFLAAEHFPLTTIWNAKQVFWWSAALLLALVFFLGGGLGFLVRELADPMRRNERVLFDFGTFPQIVGSILFFGMWLIYGFCVAQLFVLLCRKTMYALVVSVMVAGAALALWLPSILCRGMNGWQVWLLPIGLIVTTRRFIRPWSAGRNHERRPMAGLIGVAVAALVWAALNYGYRAWQIPDVGPPLDRLAFKASLPGGEQNEAARIIEEALGKMDAADQKADAWLARLNDLPKQPPGMLERPSSEGSPLGLRHLPACERMCDRLLKYADADARRGNVDAAWDRLTQVLAISRALRNKAPVASYVAGARDEQRVLDRVDDLVAKHHVGQAWLQRVLQDLTRHAAETPPALDCLHTECYCAGGLLENPTMWPHLKDPVWRSGSWLRGAIALSYEAPWESERRARLWQLVWAGLERNLRTPYWELPEPTDPVRFATPRETRFLRDWLPTAQGPDAGITAARVTQLLDDSWLGNSSLYCEVDHLRATATRSRSRVEATRLALAVLLYQLREDKTPGKLEDLVPKCLPELPIDPYSGVSFGYRVSQGEEIEQFVHNAQGERLVRVPVALGQAVVWSTGPDRQDHGGRKQGAALIDESAPWRNGAYDLITLVPVR